MSDGMTFEMLKQVLFLVVVKKNGRRLTNGFVQLSWKIVITCHSKLLKPPPGYNAKMAPSLWRFHTHNNSNDKQTGNISPMAWHEVSSV
jgi:hypothetical protein